MVMVLTGVDGTLVDRTPSSCSRVAGVLERLASEGIPVVLCSENTRAELEAVRSAVANADPFISENESAIYVPTGYFPSPLEDGQEISGYSVVACACPHAHVALTLHLLARQLEIEVVSFGDLSPEEVASTCRVSLDRARLAKLREYDEPFRIVDRDTTVRNRLVRALRAARLRCVAGDLYCHVNSVLERGSTIERLRSMYEEAFGCPVLTIGLGSSLCDLALLKTVDIPIIVRDEWPTSTETLLRKVPTARVTGASGTAGWSQAVMDVVRTMQHMRAPIAPVYRV